MSEGPHASFRTTAKTSAKWCRHGVFVFLLVATELDPRARVQRRGCCALYAVSCGDWCPSRNVKTESLPSPH